MSGTLLSTGGGGWMQLAPGESIPGVTPTPPPQQYDMWGRPVGGAGLGNLYNAVTAAQQQQLPTAPNLLGAGGFGTSGYDQWGRQAPPQPGTGAAARPALDPMSQSLVDAIGSGNPWQGNMLAQILAGVPEGQVTRGGWGGGQGLLGIEGGGAGGDRGPSQGNQGQQDAATAAGGMAASGDKGPSAGGGSAASGHDQDEEGPF